jgi:two-component system, LytTR family, response regulator
VPDLRVVVAEDEPAARRLLVRLLSSHADIRVVAECRHGREAITAIRSLAPDLVFLDVKMPELDGFGIVAEIGAADMPPIVFVTAFDEYAVRAFDVSAFDYLVKPFSDARFEEILARARHRLAERAAAPARFVVRLGNRSIVVAAEEIEWVEAQDYYALLHVGPRAHLVRQSIRTLETSLDARRFARVSRSAIINLDRVRELERRTAGSWKVTLVDGTVVPVSRRRREALVKALGPRA